MLKEYHTLFKRSMIFFDLCIVIAAFFLGDFVSSKPHTFFELTNWASGIVLLPTEIVIWVVLLYYFGMYDFFRNKQVSDILFVVLQVTLLGGTFLGSFIFITKLYMVVNRPQIMYSFLFALVFVSIEKVVFMQYFGYQCKKGINFTNMVIVGTGKRAQHFIGLVSHHTEWGIKIIGLVDDDAARQNSVVCGHRVLGSLNDIPAIIRDNVVDEIVFIVPRSWLNKLEEPIMYICEVEGIRVSVAVDLYELTFAKAKYNYMIFDTINQSESKIYKFPLLTFETAPGKIIHLLIKRLLDIVISGTMLVVGLPVFVVTAIAIKATSKGPILFRQDRVSLHGRSFSLYKFRTMVEDAETKLDSLRQYNEMGGPVFKMKNDPRTTKVGRFLRKFSIDEFPQFWNVFRGDMSLVGPRPPIPAEVSKYEPWQRRRLSMRPGITCLWQAGGRNKITVFDEWMRLDLEYIDNWSLWLDCKILLKTMPVVLFGTGAK